MVLISCHIAAAICIIRFIRSVYFQGEKWSTMRTNGKQKYIIWVRHKHLLFLNRLILYSARIRRTYKRNSNVLLKCLLFRRSLPVFKIRRKSKRLFISSSSPPPSSPAARISRSGAQKQKKTEMKSSSSARALKFKFSFVNCPSILRIFFCWPQQCF